VIAARLGHDSETYSVFERITSREENASKQQSRALLLIPSKAKML